VFNKNLGGIKQITTLQTHAVHANLLDLGVSMHCPKCSSVKYVKSGHVKGVQRYQCKECRCQFTRDIPRGRHLKTRMLAVTMYLHGISLNAIGKIVGVSTPGVLDWVRRFARDNYEKPQVSGQSVIMKLDEMWHYVKKSNVSSGSGRLLMLIQDDCLTGSVGVVTKER